MDISTERFTPKKEGQERALETKAAILKAAAKAFSDKGYEGCSIRKIAEVAGVKHQVIAFHFGSKEKLWVAVVTHLYEELQQLSEVNYEEGGDIVATFRSQLKSVVQYAANRPELLRIIYQESLSNSDRLIQLRPQIEATEQHALFHLSQLRKLGYFKGIPDVDLVFLFVGAINGRFLQPQLNEWKTGKPINHPDIVEAHTDALMRLLTRL